MSEFKGTKGPWRLAEGQNDMVVTDRSLGEGQIVAATYGDNMPENAMLISAAPELLEELQRMVAEYDSEIIDRYEGARAFDSMLAVADKARVVIAKALGEKS